MTKLLGIIGLAFIGFWYFTKRNVQPTPLQLHLNDIAKRQNIGRAANTSAIASMVPLATMQNGWGTHMRLSMANPGQSWNQNPGQAQFNARFP